MHAWLIRPLESINELIGRALAWLTLAMVIVTFAVVVLRYAFDLGWIAMQETINYMHALVFMLGAAYAFKYSAHVRVDIFYNSFSSRKKAWIDLTGNILFLLPTCGFIFLGSLDYVADSWRILESSQETGGLPFAFLLKTVIPLAALLLGIQAITDCLKQGLVILTHPEEHR
ncbi:MAG: TRAP transporter small permease subunit [Gammaproteobacteria bacterium]|nr:TRAP transporter small permease subunit [Gammaproteobacteria bacterium]